MKSSRAPPCLGLSCLLCPHWCQRFLTGERKLLLVLCLLCSGFILFWTLWRYLSVCLSVSPKSRSARVSPDGPIIVTLWSKWCSHKSNDNKEAVKIVKTIQISNQLNNMGFIAAQLLLKFVFAVTGDACGRWQVDISVHKRALLVRIEKNRIPYCFFIQYFCHLLISIFHSWVKVKTKLETIISVYLSVCRSQICRRIKVKSFWL